MSTKREGTLEKIYHSDIETYQRESTPCSTASTSPSLLQEQQKNSLHMKTPLSLLACFCTATLNAQVQMLHVKESAAATQLSSMVSSTENVQQWVILLCAAAVLGWLLFSYCIAADCRGLNKGNNNGNSNF